jgi:anti-sigma factor RsiW
MMSELQDDMTCQDLVEVVTEYLEGSLSPVERHRFELHLADCDGCVNYVNQMRHTIQVLGRLYVPDIPADEQEQLLALFRNWRRAGA